MIDKTSKLSVRKQSELLDINRSSLYIESAIKDDAYLCNMISEIYSTYLIYGYRRITVLVRIQGIIVNKKSVQRLMRMMNLRAIYPGPNTSKRKLQDAVHPYLLRNMQVIRKNQVWQTDITYLRTQNGFVYLVALIDVFSRFVVSYRISNTLCTESCIYALEDAVSKYGAPEIINSDQGSQYTSTLWIKALQNLCISVSMTGKGRCNDNANIERLWRSLKYESSYLYGWNSVRTLKDNISKWLQWYNYKRPHQALKYKVPFDPYLTHNCF